MASRKRKTDSRCPEGHATGTGFGVGHCTKEICGNDPAALAIGGGETAAVADLVPLDPTAATFADRAALVGLQKGLKGDEATKWSQEKLQELLPEAVSSLAWDMRYGTPKQRSEAADRVLKANGLDRTEARNQQTGGLIILQLGAGESQIPWLSRVSPKPPKPTPDEE